MSNDIEQTVLVINPTGKGKYRGYLPDLDISVHGSTVTEVIVNAQVKGGAIYHYSLERDVEIPLKADYSKCLKLCKGKNSFVTFVNLLA